MGESSDYSFSIEEPTEHEIAAQIARAKHSLATVSILTSLKPDESMKAFIGNGFVIGLANWELQFDNMRRRYRTIS